MPIVKLTANRGTASLPAGTPETTLFQFRIIASNGDIVQGQDVPLPADPLSPIEATFTLEPGDYTARVVAKGAGGVEIGEPSVGPFSVLADVQRVVVAGWSRT